MTKEKYIKYKDSGVSWLGNIPEHWEVRRIKYVFKEMDLRSENGDENLLSVSQYTGVTKKADKVGEGENLSNAKTLEGYKIVKKSDLVINIMLAWNGSLGISDYDGIVSPAYCVYRSLIDGEKYFGYLFKTKNAQQEFKKQSTGIIDSRLRMYTDSFFDIKTVIPPKPEQTAIANFLDYKLEKIDRFITKKKQLIELLNEQKAAIINQAVTKGVPLNGELLIMNDELKDGNSQLTTHHSQFKDSGIEWLGDIPESWDIKRLKFLAKIRNGKDCDKKDIGKYPVYGSGGIFGWNDDFLYNKPSVLLGRKGTIDKPQFVESPFWSVDTAFYTEINEKVVIPIFFYFLCSSIIPFDFYSSKTALPSMTQTDLYEVKFGIPSKEEQKEIVQYIKIQTTKIDKNISTIEKEIALVEEYKTALIAEAVTGKIDVRNYEL